MKEIPEYSIESIRSEHRSRKDFDFFRLEYLVKDIARLRAPHRHDFYTFILVTGGLGSHKIDFRSYAVKASRLFLIAPGQVHAWNKLKNIKGFMVMFTDAFVALSKGRKIMSAWPLFGSGQPCYIDLRETELHEWAHEFFQIEKECNDSRIFSRDAIFYSIGKLLVRASRLYHSIEHPATAGDTLLIKFQGLIERHFREFRNPARYAKILSVTPNYLNLVCKQRGGRAAGKLITQRVVLEAKRLLAHTELTAAEIAYRLNFDDNSYFGRYFKRQAGMTPAKFRSQQRGRS